MVIENETFSGIVQFEAVGKTFIGCRFEQLYAATFENCIFIDCVFDRSFRYTHYISCVFTDCTTASGTQEDVLVHVNDCSFKNSTLNPELLQNLALSDTVIAGSNVAEWYRNTFAQYLQGDKSFHWKIRNDIEENPKSFDMEEWACSTTLCHAGYLTMYGLNKGKNFSEVIVFSEELFYTIFPYAEPSHFPIKSFIMPIFATAVLCLIDPKIEKILNWYEETENHIFVVRQLAEGNFRSLKA